MSTNPVAHRPLPETDEAPTCAGPSRSPPLVAVALALTALRRRPRARGVERDARPGILERVVVALALGRAASDAGGLYVALGDSLAAGYQPGGAELRDTAYPALTATRLTAAGGDAHPGEPRLQRRDDDLAASRAGSATSPQAASSSRPRSC